MLNVSGASDGVEFGAFRPVVQRQHYRADFGGVHH